MARGLSERVAASFVDYLAHVSQRARAIGHPATERREVVERFIQNENLRPFGFPLDCARGFGKTGQALSL